MDEKRTGNGDVYTILTNKAAKGCKGALQMVRGLHNAVSGILRKASAPETAVCQDCHYRFIFSHDADGQKGVSRRKADQ